MDTSGSKELTQRIPESQGSSLEPGISKTGLKGAEIS